ncbi:MAG: VOC family protein [Bacteroidia bacterium]|nr:VOC family protein [Bacteroidia bacterium]
MNEIYDTYRPAGFGTITPYIMAANALELIDFYKKAFFAEELDRSTHPETGEITNCILRMGGSCFMVARGRDEFLNMRTSFYLYVSDVDQMHHHALQNGARLVFDPADMPYEDRQSGVIDPAGNYWWISKRLVEKGYEE